MLVEVLDKRGQKLLQLLSHAVTPNDFMIKIDRELFENYTGQDYRREKKDKWYRHISTYQLIVC